MEVAIALVLLLVFLLGVGLLFDSKDDNKQKFTYTEEEKQLADLLERRQAIQEAYLIARKEILSQRRRQ